jgi:hypothetical protein
MNTDTFREERISKSDAATVLRMNGERTGDFKEQRIFGRNTEQDRCFHPESSIVKAEEDLANKALEVGARYVSSYSVDHCTLQEHYLGPRRASEKVYVARVSAMALIPIPESKRPQQHEG